jgi:DNA-binding response OmpR family regulator
MQAPGKSGIVVVVDPRFEDYLPFSSARERPFVCFVPSGRAALRIARGFPDSVWIINAQLPDFSGLDLFEMVKSHLNGPPVFVVTEAFDPRDEVRALCLGAAGYHVKPVQAEWLASCRPRISIAL